ncbi:hypothetical protein BOX15_Mlig014674g1, partial [Macrostomum lignano]
ADHQSVRPEGRMIDLVDADWLDDRLPRESVPVLPSELPDLDPDSQDEQEAADDNKWTELQLMRIRRIAEQQVRGHTAGPAPPS